MKSNRYEKARKLLSIVRQGRVPNVLFTDEKILTVNSACNSLNSRQLLRRGHQKSEKASVSSRSHFPSSGGGSLSLQTFGITELDISTGLVWSVLGNYPSRTSYNNLDSRKMVLVNCWEEISQEELRSIVGNFETRL
uniref:Transposase n=1 Tax=Heterorhabditis bacteriophora TaxID=37862 RepID=A0A1I7X237_HETBA